MKPFRLLIDECVPIAVYYALRLRMPNVDILFVGDDGAPPKGTRDEKLVAYCEANGRMLISSDRTTLPRHVADHHQNGGHTWGVIIFHFDHSLEATIDEIELICRASDPNEWIDVMRHLPGW